MRRPDPIPALKAQLAREVTSHLDGWSQEMAAEWIGSEQPRMSELRRGKLTRFSLARLVRFATRIGATVRIEVLWPPGWSGPGWRERPPVRRDVATTPDRLRARRLASKHHGAPP